MIMPYNEELFEKYDLLVPAKFDGGLLVIALHHKILAKQLDRLFTTTDIRRVLEEISLKHGENAVQSERIIKNLLHFFLRTVPDEPGKYYLTDLASEWVELMNRWLNNPYKNYPLKRSFERHFVIRSNEIRDITDLQRKFDREFVGPHKNIINHHLAALDDELREATAALNKILRQGEESATVQVRNFATVFKKFGERAEDITSSIESRDHFLRSLRIQVDFFYKNVQSYKHPNTDAEFQELEKLKADWTIAASINNDLDEFFRTVDEKIATIRRQILYASEKLSELHENFSSRATFRLKLKQLLSLTLDNAQYHDKELQFGQPFPERELVYEKTQLFYPERHFFEVTTANKVIEIAIDKEYERQHRLAIDREIHQQELINIWVAKGKEILQQTSSMQLAPLMETIMTEENDFAVAHQVAIELTQYVAESEQHQLTIEQTPYALQNTNTIIWNIILSKATATPSSPKKK